MSHPPSSGGGATRSLRLGIGAQTAGMGTGSPDTEAMGSASPGAFALPRREPLEIAKRGHAAVQAGGFDMLLMASGFWWRRWRVWFSRHVYLSVHMGYYAKFEKSNLSFL